MLSMFSIYGDPVSCLIIMLGFLCYSTKCIACILRSIGRNIHWIFWLKKRLFLLRESNFCIYICIHAMGSLTLIMCSWMLVEKAGKIPLRMKITAYWKLFVCYILSSNIFCGISELLYFSICWNDGFHTFCFVKWQKLKENIAQV